MASKIATIISSSFLGVAEGEAGERAAAAVDSTRYRRYRAAGALLRSRLVLWMSTGVNDTIHVQVQVVELNPGNIASGTGEIQVKFCCKMLVEIHK